MLDWDDNGTAVALEVGLEKSRNAKEELMCIGIEELTTVPEVQGVLAMAKRCGWVGLARATWVRVRAELVTAMWSGALAANGREEPWVHAQFLASSKERSYASQAATRYWSELLSSQSIIL